LHFEKHPRHAAEAALTLEGPSVTAFDANALHVGVLDHASF
jgi:hypothetical protein